MKRMTMTINEQQNKSEKKQQQENVSIQWLERREIWSKNITQAALRVYRK